MCIKAVIFDMDGVLIDAKEWHYAALNRALAVFGYAISRTDHERKYDGLPTREKLNCLSETVGLPRALHARINELKQQFTLHIVAERLHPNFTHMHALSRLRQEGYVVGLASNSIRQSIDTMMRRSELAGYLDFSLSNEDVNQGKPSPEIYEKAVSMADVEPTETLVIEDNPIGVQAAEGAGAHVLQVGGVDDVTYRNIRRAIVTVDRLSQPSLRMHARAA